MPKIKLEFPKYDNPLVSIIVPVYNQYKHTKQCLEYILSNTKDVSYEVIIADDNSSDETVNILDDFDNIFVIRNKANMGFLRNVNNAVSNTKGKYICLLNNDTLPLDGWLQYLVQTIELNNKVGIVGAKILSTNGLIEETGCIMDSQGMVNLLGNGQSKYAVDFSNREIEVDYCSGCGILLSKENWDKVGGFDESYAPAYYEDSDLAFTFKYNLGLITICQTKAEIIHSHSATYQHHKNTLNVEKNRSLFIQKWKHVLPQNTVISDSNNNFDPDKYLYMMSVDLGRVFYEKQEYKKALQHYEEGLSHFNIMYMNLADAPDVNNNLLVALNNNIADVKNNIVNILNMLGDKCFNSKDLEGALNYYKKIVLYAPEDKLVYVKLGKCLQDLGALSSAISFLEKGASLNPEAYEIYKIIGDIYNNLKNLEKAINYYTMYVETCPINQNHPLVYNIIGHLYETLGQYHNIDKQIDAFEKAIELMPNLKSAYKNLTVVYPRAGRDSDAFRCYQQLFKLGATMDDYFDYACLQIKHKNFEEGWKFYEYRFSKENGPTVYPKTSKPKWKGQNIEGKTLLVQYEQGFGDSLQFFRYLDQLKPFAKKIIFRVQNELVDLLKINSGDIDVVGMSTPLEKISFDYHVPLMSLLHLLHARVDNIPHAQGYLRADENKIKEYKEKYFNNNCLKIGISWRGAVTGNKRRNVDLSAFEVLTNMENVKVYSFQKDADSQELRRNLSTSAISLGETFNNFADTAAAMANLDLFVTGDNALFNLAGAMGVKTCLLLNKDSEWRWFFDDKTTPWYDSVKIFKKKDENDDWRILTNQVADTISKEQLTGGTSRHKRKSTGDIK